MLDTAPTPHLKAPSTHLARFRPSITIYNHNTLNTLHIHPLSTLQALHHLVQVAAASSEHGRRRRCLPGPLARAATSWGQERLSARWKFAGSTENSEAMSHRNAPWRHWCVLLHGQAAWLAWPGQTLVLIQRDSKKTWPSGSVSRPHRLLLWPCNFLSLHSDALAREECTEPLLKHAQSSNPQACSHSRDYKPITMDAKSTVCNWQFHPSLFPPSCETVPMAVAAPRAWKTTNHSLKKSCFTLLIYIRRDGENTERRKS